MSKTSVQKKPAVQSANIDRADKPNLPYAGHRERVRSRFRETGLAGFQDYEIMEYLLFSVFPQGDTKPRARKIIAQFGSLAAFFQASPAQRRMSEEITENTALQIDFLIELYRHLLESQLHRIQFDQTNLVCAYFYQLYAFETTEVLRIATLNNQRRLLRCHLLACGSSGDVTINLRKLIEIALVDHSDSIVLIHNHPEQTADFSMADYNTTRDLLEYLMPLSIQLFDHIIIGKTHAVSMREMGYLQTLYLNEAY